MVKITVGVDGMMCGHCEAHVNDAIRNAFEVKDVKSSHSNKKTEIIAEAPLDEAKIKEIIIGTGYTVTSMQTEEYEKKGFSLFHKK